MKSNVFVGVKGNGLVESDIYQDKYDYMLVSITNIRYRDSVKKQYGKLKSGVLQDLHIDAPQLQDLGVPALKASENGVGFIGLISSWLELESPNPDAGEMSYQVLRYEFEYARSYGIKQVILAPPRNLGNLNFYVQKIARLLYSIQNDRPTTRLPLLSISLPLFEDTDPLSTWELWNTIRKQCKYHPLLTITLALPRCRTPSYVLNRWLAEPVSCLLVSSSIFATNQYNYPVLNKFNQELITKFQKINGDAESNLGELTVILHGLEKHVDKIRGGEAIYLEYINYLLKKGDKMIIPQHADSFWDKFPRIMSPLQPNFDNLSNEVYQTFEKDKKKYDLYEMAINQALQYIVQEQNKKWMRESLTILVAGAGRGPLVGKAFECLKKMSITNFKLIALEKNPQALLYLQKKNFENWANSVDIVPVNMRKWDSSVKVDLCISELLGSFGCNELSPECLEALQQRNCHAKTIFIPQSYTSYVAPVSSPLLYQKLREQGASALQSPWIVHNIPYCILSNKINELWTFEHPSKEPTTTRSAITHLKIKHKGELHGIIGFFTAQLYKNIQLSILPDDSTVRLHEPPLTEDDTGVHLGIYKKINHTVNMASWSPIFFPLSQPLYISDDTELELSMARNKDCSRVWYEWSVNSYVYIVVTDDGKPTSAPCNSLKNSASRRKFVKKASGPFPSGKKSDEVNKAFANFQLSPQVLPSSDIEDSTESLTESNVDDNVDTTELFERTFTGKSEFISPELSGWKSICDIHGLGNAIPYLFENDEPILEDQEDKEQSHYEEYRARVRTNVTELHNLGGEAHSIKI
ncbi:protein arginine N-methyltransferase Ecym_5439 [Eremothecium cymbalariae DBVPG|uniref:Protein arginine N-methyltransferase n=1 Tax=Eremothecium cymbalariae (strain CBS 270.75 / DBVPG 7215 / KCTC 17166 / NRRL Y-17582) TaxID=931890 RepID=I6NDP9_ERECY|nr:hypothetical protein Ecym_5439 [Eremothecium cymbalariae DBVPG\